MAPRHPGILPEPLRGTVFTTATARDAGVGPERIRGKGFDARIHGARATQGADDPLRVRCRMFAARLPAGVFFSHSTAARLLGIPLPLRFERFPFLHVTVEAPSRAPHAAGLRGHSRAILPGDVMIMPDGLAVSSPDRVLCEMASVLDLPDLVAVVDHLIHHKRPLTTLADLAERIAVRDRISRPRMLPRALEYADERAESRPESWIRVHCILAGLPRPIANHEVINPVTGRPNRFDLAWPHLKIAVEYHGDPHRQRDQWRKDLRRKAELESDGWIIVELTGDDLASPQGAVDLIRAAFARRA